MQFGNDFDAVVCKIRNLDGSRYRDWCLWSRNHSILDWIVFPNRTLIPYEFTQVRSKLYFSGAFWVAKKGFMETFPLNEDLTAGEAEDVEWSKRVQTVTQLRLNAYSEVSFLKNNLVVMQEPGRFRLFCIKIFLGTRLYKLDKIYKRIPSALENVLYGLLSLISDKLLELKRSTAKS